MISTAHLPIPISLCVLSSSRMRVMNHNIAVKLHYWRHYFVQRSHVRELVLYITIRHSAGFACRVVSIVYRIQTARGHMMSLPLHVCNGLARPADAAYRIYCEMCEVIGYVEAPV